MRQKTIITKLLQSVTEVYYKVCRVLQSVTTWPSTSSITKCGRVLLQSATVITKWDATQLQKFRDTVFIF